MATPHTWTCSRCDRTFVGRSAIQPAGWEWSGSELLCDDCTGEGRDDGDLPIGPGGPPSLRSGARPDADVANLIRNGAARDIADPDGARVAA